MNHKYALDLYNLATLTSMGVNGDGDEVRQTTAFGIMMTAHGAPTWLSQYSGCEPTKEEMGAVTAYLRKWADALEKGE